MNTKQVLNSALHAFDQVGFRLDQYGIVSNVNRHQVIAYLMAEQKHLEGEFDSLIARIDLRKAQVESIRGRVEGSARDGLNFALRPARYTLSSLQGLLSKA